MHIQGAVTWGRDPRPRIEIRGRGLSRSLTSRNSKKKTWSRLSYHLPDWRWSHSTPTSLLSLKLHHLCSLHLRQHKRESLIWSTLSITRINSSCSQSIAWQACRSQLWWSKLAALPLETMSSVSSTERDHTQMRRSRRTSQERDQYPTSATSKFQRRLITPTRHLSDPRLTASR